MSEHDLVLHIGMQQSGATMLQRALSRLRPQLRARGVTYIGHGRISSFDHLAGWHASAGADPDQADAFAGELSEAVAHERRTSAAGSGTVLISSDHLTGSHNIDGSDGNPFRPQAVPAVHQVIQALGATRVRLVLFTQRQDRLMEFCYLREVQNGRHHSFAQQFPQRFEPILDYPDLIARLAALPEVMDVTVRPFELVEAGPVAFVDAFLDVIDLRGTLDLDAVGTDLAPHHVYSRRGLKIALAMNPHLDTRKDRRLVREFLLEQFAAPDDRQSRFIPKRARQRILEAYREQNRTLFRTYMPDLPEDSYESNQATARLGSVLHPPATGHDQAGQPAQRALVGMLPLYAGGAKDRREAGSAAMRHAPVNDRIDAFKDAIARLADRSPPLYRAKVRYLTRRCDAFLVSFPKCGRTWLRVMLGIALGDHFGVRVRNLRRFTNAGVDHPSVPRVLATHDDSPQVKPAQQIIADKRAYRTTKVILLVRDPRDVVVSLYFHVTRRRRQRYDGSLSDFVRDPVGSLASLLAFYDAWSTQLGAGNVLLVRYEDMHADPGRELRRVLEFLGVTDVTGSAIERAVTGASFERLQRVEREGTAGTRALRTDTAHDPESYKVRRGKVGGYVDYLDAHDVRDIDAAIAASNGARALGYALAGGEHT
jgi:Sulfotransferase domain